MGEEGTKGPNSGGFLRGVYIVVGTVALIVGAVGLFLPVLPTTPFVILAAACYYRGSDRLHKWILNSKWFGETIRNFQAGRGLTRGTKLKAISMMWAMIIISTWFYVNGVSARVAMFCVGVVVTVYLVRLPTWQ